MSKGGGDKALYSLEVFEVLVQQNANFQEVCQVDGSQSWKDCCEHGKRKFLVNVAMPALLYRAPIWGDAINVREYRRTEMVSGQWKAVLRCVSSYCTVFTEAVCVMAGISPTAHNKTIMDECKWVYIATC